MTLLSDRIHALVEERLEKATAGGVLVLNADAAVTADLTAWATAASKAVSASADAKATTALVYVGSGLAPDALRAALLTVWTGLSEGGLLIVHDYDGGKVDATRAIDAALASFGRTHVWRGFLIPDTDPPALGVVKGRSHA